MTEHFPGREAIVVTTWLGVADTAPELMQAPGGLLVAAVESLGEVMEVRAHALAADLIVLGSRGQGAVTAAILGSVSTGVLHHADRSVLIVSDQDPA